MLQRRFGCSRMPPLNLSTTRCQTPQDHDHHDPPVVDHDPSFADHDPSFVDHNSSQNNHNSSQSDHRPPYVCHADVGLLGLETLTQLWSPIRLHGSRFCVKSTFLCDLHGGLGLYWTYFFTFFNVISIVSFPSEDEPELLPFNSLGLFCHN